MAARPERSHVWRSDTLLLGGLNAFAYAWTYANSGWQIPHEGTYLCWLGALVSFVPAPREISAAGSRRAAITGFLLSCIVLWHIVAMPCTGPCK
jgi:hypothetical protein